MKEEFISFETAKLAKEKGFATEPDCALYSQLGYTEDGILLNGWDYDGGQSANNTDESLEQFYEDYDKRLLGVEKPVVCMAYGQHLLQRWLREEKNLNVFILPRLETNTYSFIVLEGLRRERAKNVRSFDTYESALECGLQEALKLIKV